MTDIYLVPVRMHTATVDSFVKVHYHPAVQGTTIVSRIVVTVGNTSYEEVAVHDTRALDTRDHRWKQVASNLGSGDARRVFDVVVDAAMRGHRVYGVRWIDGRPEPVVTRDGALEWGLIEQV
jgi:hypothetical protein